jgi:hexokinase
MENNRFALSLDQQRKIGLGLQQKIDEGLRKDGEEIACLPTYINPGKDFEGNVLALDWGGTNFRAAIVQFRKDDKPLILENLKQPLSYKEIEGFKQEDLFDAMAALIVQLKHLDASVTHIGYCFSYPAESTLSGDAIVLRWTKEIDLPDMLNKLVGKPLLAHLNRYEGMRTQFQTIKVVNDTIACLFAGLAQPGYDSYIGLIVGTGTNMAALIHKNNIEKLSKEYNGGDLIPINLESGNLKPQYASQPYLTPIDQRVDERSKDPGRQLFEKAMSGGYIGSIFRNAFPEIAVEAKFDGEKLSNLMNFPAIYKDEYVATARQIYTRSAQLVASSLAGLTLILASYKTSGDYDKSLTNICLAADGSLFWSNDRNGKDYHELVRENLESLLTSFGLGHIHFHMNRLDDANLIGSAIAALS